MKEQDINLTLHELEQLCRLYMDCRLSLLEEKELEYVLRHTALTSPEIDEVRALMDVTVPAVSAVNIRKQPKRIWLWLWRPISGVAASVALIAGLISTFSGSFDSGTSPELYIAAYSCGHQLNEAEAIASTERAMAKADALLNYAALAERNSLMKAENMISMTPDN